MGEVIKFPEKREGVKKFFESEKGYVEYQKQERVVTNKAAEPSLTLRNFWYILTKRI